VKPEANRKNPKAASIIGQMEKAVKWMADNEDHKTETFGSFWRTHWHEKIFADDYRAAFKEAMETVKA